MPSKGSIVANTIKGGRVYGFNFCSLNLTTKMKSHVKLLATQYSQSGVMQRVVLVTSDHKHLTSPSRFYTIVVFCEDELNHFVLVDLTFMIIISFCVSTYLFCF